jgi:hypothetical protein
MNTNMKPYSIDFREKIVKAYEKGDTPLEKLLNDSMSAKASSKKC